MLASRYAIERELGRGGMAIVYLARDLPHSRDVAVKVFRAEGGPPDGADRFLQEIQIASRLAHPNILPVHDSGHADGLLYFVMPFVPGENLRQRLDREGALPVADALTIAVEVAGALAYAHSHGVIHRDIKPENILSIAGHSVVADFGIARAISAGGWVESQLGRGADGTPAYMSPEQGRGGSRVDGRSDIYSLGCVLYEMLTGDPPFRGSTPEELVVQHMGAEPLPVQARRPTLSRQLQAVVGKALAKHPADRYQTAQQFADALTKLLNQQSQEVALRPTREIPVWRRPALAWALLPVMAVVAVLYAIFRQADLGGWGERPDPDRYLVAPFVHRDSSAPELLRGDQCARLLHQALTRWEDVSVVDSRWTTDRLLQLRHEPTLGELNRLTRSANAGRLVSGEVFQVGDSIRVRGVLYDVTARNRVIREFTVALDRSLDDADQRFTTLADSLLLPRAHTGLASGGATGTRTIAAWQAYDSGHVALSRWDLAGAARHFSHALERDPGYGLAQLWLAQTLNWQGEDASHWRDQVLAGLGARPALVERDREWALALAALADGRYPEACERYAAMLRRDSLDFRGWYGRAECRAEDHLVEADPKSPTGWRFRSSYQAAIQDYQRALTLVPSSHLAFRGAAFSRLSELFFTEPNMLRRGHRAAPGADPRAFDFAAYPALQHDTLAFFPQPFADLTGVRAKTRLPSTIGQAVEAGRRALLGVTGEWARAFPGSAEAQASYGLALELAGELSDGGVGTDRVARQFAVARARATDPELKINLATAELRIMVKRGQLPEAGRFADSLLKANPTPTPAVAPYLAAAAALRGRAALAASLARRAAPLEYYWGPDGRVLSVPLPLRETALALEAYAALGGPVDSVARLERQARQQLAGMVGEQERRDVGMTLFDRSHALLYPASAGTPLIPAHEPRDHLIQLQQLVGARHPAEARQLLQELREHRRNLRVGDVALEVAFQEFQLDLAIGDTAGAVAGLDRVLASATTQGSDLMVRVAPTGAMVRAMVLRARLASQSGDDPTLARYAGAVGTLWDRADPALAREASELRQLMSARVH